MWGECNWGQVGIGRKTRFMDVPFSLGKFTGKGFLDIAPGFTHSLAVDRKKKLYVWGLDRYGCHGTKEEEYKLKPIKINSSLFKEFVNEYLIV